MLVLLDFSSAFDTLDHRLLLSRLSDHYGITGMALRWLSPYPQGRTQSVAINEALSDSVNVSYGVPQGSVAGPVLFTMYSAPIQDIIATHHAQCADAVYADDVQLYLTFDLTVILQLKGRDMHE